jgi:hypothetical protein
MKCTLSAYLISKEQSNMIKPIIKSSIVTEGLPLSVGASELQVIPASS